MGLPMELLPYTRDDIGREFEVDGRRVRLAGIEAVNEVGDSLLGPGERPAKIRVSFLDADGNMTVVDYQVPPGYDTEASR